MKKFSRLLVAFLFIGMQISASESWDEVNFDIDCVDSLQCQNNKYYFIYDSPDQFETVLYINIDEITYAKLEYCIAHRKWEDRFHLLYKDDNFMLIFK